MTLHPLSPAALTAALKEEARRLGFDLAGAAPAVTPPGIARFRQWLADGYAGEMRYLADRAAAYEHPSHILDGARSVLMLAANYRTSDPERAGAGQGKVSRYAWGADYHDVLHDRLRRLADLHGRLVPHAGVRGVVDTAPLMEREFAQLAGLGWIGRNTLLLNRQLGSWFFLAALLSTEELQYDEPGGAGHCGSCRACLDACPTGALVAPYRLDARRCISYLTIELRGPVPADLRPAMGERWFGCDACQEACPWNRRTLGTAVDAFRPNPGMNPTVLAELFSLDETALRERFRHTPLWRAKRRGLLRNAAIVVGNRPDPAAMPALLHGLDDVEPLVRGASAWAIGRIGTSAVRQALRDRLAIESDASVRVEMQSAMDFAGES